MWLIAGLSLRRRVRSHHAVGCLTRSSVPEMQMSIKMETGTDRREEGESMLSSKNTSDLFL